MAVLILAKGINKTSGAWGLGTNQWLWSHPWGCDMQWSGDEHSLSAADTQSVGAGWGGKAYFSSESFPILMFWTERDHLAKSRESCGCRITPALALTHWAILELWFSRWGNRHNLALCVKNMQQKQQKRQKYKNKIAWLIHLKDKRHSSGTSLRNNPAISQATSAPYDGKQSAFVHNVAHLLHLESDAKTVVTICCNKGKNNGNKAAHFHQQTNCW